MAVDGIRGAGGASMVSSGLQEDYREELLRRLRERKRQGHRALRPETAQDDDGGAAAAERRLRRR